jgi:hypothetical protein
MLGCIRKESYEAFLDSSVENMERGYYVPDVPDAQDMVALTPEVVDVLLEASRKLRHARRSEYISLPLEQLGLSAKGYRR